MLTLLTCLAEELLGSCDDDSSGGLWFVVCDTDSGEILLARGVTGRIGVWRGKEGRREREKERERDRERERGRERGIEREREGEREGERERERERGREREREGERERSQVIHPVLEASESVFHDVSHHV